MAGDDQIVAGLGRITVEGVDAVEQARETEAKRADDQSVVLTSRQATNTGTVGTGYQKSVDLDATRQPVLSAVSRLQESPSAFVSDKRIAEELGHEVQYVRDHLDLMEELRLVQLAKSKAGASAMLTARGRLALQDPSLLKGQARAADVLTGRSI